MENFDIEFNEGVENNMKNNLFKNKFYLRKIMR